MADKDRILTNREVDYVTLRSLGCPDVIAKRALTGIRGEKRTDVLGKNESFEDFLKRTNPARLERLEQRLNNETAHRVSLARAARIGEQVLRDIENDFK